jgi:hypothetical protein
MDASGQEQSDEQQAEEKPVGIEEQRTIESQQAQAQISTEDVNELSPTITEEIIGKAQEKEESKASRKQNVEKTKAKLELSTKLFDQFTKHFQVSKLASSNTNNILKQIQKQLTQVDKTTAISYKQQVVIGQLVSQVKVMQKQLDKIGSSVNKIKSTASIKRKGASHKGNKK